MSKNYDLYPASERKIDNWRRRILGYEKMKRDMQRQIQILKNKNKHQKEVIDRIFNETKETRNILNNNRDNNILSKSCLLSYLEIVEDLLKEVSE